MPSLQRHGFSLDCGGLLPLATTGSPVYARIYCDAMKVVKVRRVGNSNVVSIPKEFEASGYTPGSSVLVEELAGGDLRILPTDHVRERIRQVGRRVINEHPEALRILAQHDPDAEPPVEA